MSLLNWNKDESTDNDLVFYEEQGEIHMKTIPKKYTVPIYINSHGVTSENYQKKQNMTSYSLKKQQNYGKIKPKKVSPRPIANLPNRISPKSPPAKKPKRMIWCGNCSGCLTKDNCGLCTNCRNKKLRQKCKNRWCKLQLSPAYHNKKESLKYEDSEIDDEIQCFICSRICQSPSGLNLHMRRCAEKKGIDVNQIKRNIADICSRTMEIYGPLID